MFVKFVTLFALMAVAAASNINSFSYSVADPITGDFKHQVENSVENNRVGQYSLLESDGTRRTVDYTAGAEGFNAVVRKDPALIAAAPAISYAAPAISYAAPAISYAAPAISYGAPAIAAPISYSAPLGYAKFGGINYGAFPYARYY